jgi:hypothetical protein
MIQSQRKLHLPAHKVLHVLHSVSIVPQEQSIISYCLLHVFNDSSMVVFVVLIFSDYLQHGVLKQNSMFCNRAGSQINAGQRGPTLQLIVPTCHEYVNHHHECSTVCKTEAKLTCIVMQTREQKPQSRQHSTTRTGCDVAPQDPHQLLHGCDASSLCNYNNPGSNSECWWMFVCVSRAVHAMWANKCCWHDGMETYARTSHWWNTTMHYYCSVDNLPF